MLKCIINNNEDILRYEVLKSFEEEGYIREEIIHQKIFSPIKSSGLFDSKNAIWLELKKNEGLPNFKQYLKKAKNPEEDIKCQDIIISLLSVRECKPILDFVKKNGGVVEKNTNRDSKYYLDKYKIPDKTKKIIIDYIGQDTEKVLPLLNYFDSISEDKIKKLTPADIIITISNTPGAVPYFNFLDPMIKGDVQKTLREYRRVRMTLNEFVCMIGIKQKVDLIQKAYFLKKAGLNTSKKVAETIGSHPYPVKLIWHTTSFSQNKIERMVEITRIMEDGIKGGFPNSQKEEIFQRYLVELTLLMKGETW